MILNRNKISLLTGCLMGILTLGSCATYHTPMSRDIMAGTLPEQSMEIQDRRISSQSPFKAPRNILLDWPVDKARMTRGFLPKKKRPHLGLDLAAPRGTPVFAAHSGTVIYAGREFRGYGNMVLVETGVGVATLYAHFDKIYVSEGQKVRQGEVIGGMGMTGRASGVHLHFEVRKDRSPVDPLPLLPKSLAQR